jgi:hypothetical protein
MSSFETSEDRVRDSDVLEQVTSVPFKEFERALCLMTTAPELVPAHLAELAEHFRSHPEEEYVMGPNFLSVLALFSERGRVLAENAMKITEIRLRQREVAAKAPAVAEAFPHLAGPE